MGDSLAYQGYQSAKWQRHGVGLQVIPERTGHYQRKMAVEPQTVKILDLKHHLASCLPGGRLNFHWKCMMAPATVLDYIMVHELAHIRYPNHTAPFWN